MLSQRVQEALGLRNPPVAIGFLDAAPAGLPRREGGEVPAGCVFWVEAMAGGRFYTAPEDHYNCPVGCHTHAIPLPPGRVHELPDAVRCMVEAGYLSMGEVLHIPVLARSPAFVAYGPADDPGFVADAILIAARPAQAMLLFEAAAKAGAPGAAIPAMGRPACAVLPATVNGGTVTASLGCKGNRVFTGLPDDEMYICVPASRWSGIASSLLQVCEANRAMEAYYRAKQA